MTEARQPCAIGLDVGGTKIAAGLVLKPSGQVLQRRVIPTRPERGGDAVLDDVIALTGELLAEAARQWLEVLGIGVGMAELVDRQGRITSAHTIGWQGLPVQSRLAELAPTVVEADVRAAALAEAQFGAGQEYRLFTYVTVGTGISTCLVQAGRPYAGARGNALVLGSSPLTTQCHECGSVLTPVLEEIAAGPALVAQYNQRVAPDRRLTRGEDVMAALAQDDPVAAAVIDQAGDALGVSVGWLVNVLDPDAVVVGGGLGLAGGRYWDRFVAATRQHIWADNSRRLPIIPAALGPDAGLIGAAAGVWLS
ncbi:MAG: ROK family protein [Anaerolineales bacterium]|nr:ROK family protein [Anaerolineales bacterium]